MTCPFTFGGKVELIFYRLKPADRQVIILQGRLKMKKIFFLKLLVFSLFFLLCACTATDEKNRPAPAEGTLIITDFLSREVAVKKEPERIISLAPSTTEILFALGAGENLVGVTNYDDYPPEVKNLPRVSDYAGANLEAILRQEPDIIFASNLSGQDEIEALEKLGIPVVMLQANSLSQIADSIRFTAQITGREKEGEKLVAEMEEKRDTLALKLKDAPRLKVFYLVDANGTWTTGRGTFIHELIELAGGENVAGGLNGWVQYSLDKIIQEDPSVIITAPHATHGKKVYEMPGLKDTRAIKEGRFYVISDDNIVSRPSYRIVRGLEEIAEFLHPEVFE